MRLKGQTSSFFLHWGMVKNGEWVECPDKQTNTIKFGDGKAS